MTCHQHHVIPISDDLRAIAAMFAAAQDTGCELDAAATTRLNRQLDAIADLASSMEAELRAHRAVEQTDGARRFLDNEATRTLTSAAAAVHRAGNVFHPDFGRKS